MSFLGKITSKFKSITPEVTPQTFIPRTTGGFERMGAYTKDVDTRTTQQLLGNIDYMASHNPEVARFAKELKEMAPEHLSLASDVCELANKMVMLPTNINLKNNGIFEKLLEHIVFASKENPKALTFVQEVLNQTDSTTSKYFLHAITGGLLKNKNLAQNFVATKPFVKDIAQQTLDGGYTMDYSKQENFLNMIKSFFAPNADAEKIDLLSDVIKLVENREKNYMITIDRFIQNDAPIARIKDNMTTFNKVADLAEAEGKTIDVINYLNNNVNLY